MVIRTSVGASSKIIILRWNIPDFLFLLDFLAANFSWVISKASLKLAAVKSLSALDLRFVDGLATLIHSWYISRQCSVFQRSVGLELSKIHLLWRLHGIRLSALDQGHSTLSTSLGNLAAESVFELFDKKSVEYP